MDKKDIEIFSDQTVNRYSTRFQEMKHNIRTLGWGSQEQQHFRFEQVISRLNYAEKSVLDIGCGFGDLYNFMKEKNHSPKEYIGWDITPEFINNPLIDDSNVKLEIKNIANFSTDTPVADVGIMLGLLNWNWKDADKNYDYSMKLIRNAFNAVNDVLVVDFLSTHYDPDYPVEDIVFYHDPGIMIEKIMELTPNFEIVHNYPAIPQKEFLLYLYK